MVVYIDNRTAFCCARAENGVINAGIASRILDNLSASFQTAIRPRKRGNIDHDFPFSLFKTECTGGASFPVRFLMFPGLVFGTIRKRKTFRIF